MKLNIERNRTGDFMFLGVSVILIMIDVYNGCIDNLVCCVFSCICAGIAMFSIINIILNPISISVDSEIVRFCPSLFVFPFMECVVSDIADCGFIVIPNIETNEPMIYFELEKHAAQAMCRGVHYPFMVKGNRLFVYAHALNGNYRDHISRLKSELHWV